MKGKKVNTLLAMAGVALIASCGSSGLGVGSSSPGEASVALTFKAAEPSGNEGKAPQMIMLSTPIGEAVAITKSKVVVEEVKFETEEVGACEDLALELKGVTCLAGEMEVEFKLDGPFIVDLLAGTTSPEIAPMTLPSGTFDKIVAKVAPLDEEFASLATSPDFIGHSLAIGGQLGSGETARRFLIASAVNANVKFEDPAGFTVPASVDVQTIVLSFSADALLAGIDIGACLDSGEATLLEDGTYLITDETPGKACDFKKMLRENLRAAGTAEVKEAEEMEMEIENEDNKIK